MFLIIYPLSDFHNSKWQIQASIRENEKKNDTIDKNMYSEVFGVADNESIVRFPEFEMARSFSVDLFLSNVWCSFLCRLFGVSPVLCRVFRVDFLMSNFRRVRLISVQYERL